MTNTQLEIMMRTIDAWLDAPQEERDRLRRSSERQLMKNSDAVSIFDSIPGEFPICRESSAHEEQ